MIRGKKFENVGNLKIWKCGNVGNLKIGGSCKMECARYRVSEKMSEYYWFEMDAKTILLSYAGKVMLLFNRLGF